MAALVIDMISFMEITYNKKIMCQTVVNSMSSCVLLSCCCELRSPSLKFITLLYILLYKSSKKGYFVPETTKVWYACIMYVNYLPSQLVHSALCFRMLAFD